MTAHVAGLPIEELVYVLAPTVGVVMAATRVAWTRMRPRQRQRAPLGAGIKSPPPADF